MIFIIFLFLFSINKFNNVYNEKKNTFNNGNDYRENIVHNNISIDKLAENLKKKNILNNLLSNKKSIDEKLKIIEDEDIFNNSICFNLLKNINLDDYY